MHPVTNSDANEKLEEKVPQMPRDLKSIHKPLENFGRMKAKVQIKHFELQVKCRENYSFKNHMAMLRRILQLVDANQIIKLFYRHTFLYL